MSTAVAVPFARAPSRSPTAILVGKLFRRKLVLAGTAILVVVTLLALLAPWITPYGPMAMKISDRLQSPRLAHWFGGYIRSWLKSSAPIVRAELRRRIFAK